MLDFTIFFVKNVKITVTEKVFVKLVRYFVISLVKPLLSRSFCVNYGNLSHNFKQNFRENNGFTKEVTKELISRNIFGEREFLVFPHCGVENADVFPPFFSQ